MKKQLLVLMAAVMCFPQAAFAAESSSRYKYTFETGADIEYAKYSGTNETGRNVLTENIRRDKDVQVMPPPYFTGDGVIATASSNPYIVADSQNYYSVTTPTDSSVVYDTLGTGVNSYGTSIGNGIYVDSTTSSKKETEAWEYTDGSIGTLKINSIDLEAKVYDGETTTNMRKGLGHFTYTSCWDGNVGLAGHNNTYFEDLKDVEKGDRITYTTRYGTRKYKVTSIKTIDEDDFTDLLDDTNDNRLTLITCVRNQSTKRLCVIAKEVD